MHPKFSAPNRRWRPEARIQLTICAVLLAASISGCKSIDDPPHQFAATFWHERLTDCSGSKFTWTEIQWFQMDLTQYSNPSVWVRTDALSDADRMNGFQWLGATGISASSWREVTSKPMSAPYRGVVDIKFDQFGPWINGSPQMGLRMWERKGQWHIGTQDNIAGFRDYDPFGSSRTKIPRTVDCSVVPKE
jgi:hypothetical protein